MKTAVEYLSRALLCDPIGVFLSGTRRAHRWRSLSLRSIARKSTTGTHSINVFADSFGFPDFYGRNMNAWIDCMTDLDDRETGMSRVTVRAGEVLTLRLESVDEFAVQCKEQYAALIDCAAFVNWRRMGQGQSAVLALAFHRCAPDSS